jgi:basic membrane protein A
MTSPAVRALVWGALVLSALPAVAGCAKNGAAAPGSPAPPRVALVVDGSDRGDPQLNALALKGLQSAKELLGADVASLRADTDAAYQADLTVLVDQDYDEVVAVGPAVANGLTQVARRYPRRNFALLGGVSTEPNVAGVIFRTSEGAYLAGALAATVHERGAIDVVAGTGAAGRALANGFIAGVRALHATAQTVDSGPPGGTLVEPAGTLYENDGGLVFSTARGPVPGRVLARVVERADVAIVQIAADARSQKLPAGPAVYGIAEGGVELGLTPRARALAGTRGLAQLARLRDAIASKTLLVR